MDADADYSRLLNNAGIGTGRATAAASDGADVYGKAMWNESIDDDFQNGVPCFFGSTDHELTCVPAYLSNCSSRVAIITSRISDGKACLLANYRGIGQYTRISVYEFLMP